MNKILESQDGSSSCVSSVFNESYHSIHGAAQETQHVFIKNAYDYYLNKNISKSELNILEMGFGTGLNALMTYLKNNFKVKYTSLEAYPLDISIVEKLNYPDFFKIDRRDFLNFHLCEYNKCQSLSELFYFKKILSKLEDFLLSAPTEKYDIVYFDAFSPDVQPELWTESIFEGLFNIMSSNGVLTTYCAKGSVRRTLEKTGFIVERLEGPPFKREMLRALK